VRNVERNIPFGRHELGGENDIKRAVKGIGCEDVN
jgi:hypothetical protein